MTKDTKKEKNEIKKVHEPGLKSKATTQELHKTMEKPHRK